MNSPSPTTPETARLPALDGLRGVAILMVVFWHYYACVPRPEALREVPLLELLAGYGWAGVPLFFILSGFLIGRILVEHRGADGYYRVFFIRRALRILPLYFLCLAGYALVRAWLPPAQHPSLAQLFATDAPLWSYPVFLQNFFMAQSGTLGGAWLATTWSLAVEEQFYLVLPLIVAVVRPSALPRVLVALIGAAVLFRWVVLAYGLGTGASLIVLLPSRIDGLAIGVLVGMNVSSPLPRHVGRWICAAGVAFCVATVYAARSASPVYLALLYTLLAGAFGFVALQVKTSADGHVSRLLSLPPLRWLGGVSYFVYLFHQPAQHLVHFAFARQVPNLGSEKALGLTVLSLALVLALGELSRRYLEGPLIRLGRRFEYGRKAPSAPVIALGAARSE